jgi:hypothetical protein
MGRAIHRKILRVRKRVANQIDDANREANSLSKITRDADCLSEVIVKLMHG